MGVDTPETFLEIESPLSLIPDLGALGIDEVDKGVCEDTPENRALIREANLNHTPIYTTAGEDTPLIQVFSGDQKAAVLVSAKGAILIKPRDPNSDYLSGVDLLMESEATNMVPAWVIAATKRWVRIEQEREETGKLQNPKVIGPPTRCRMMRADGHRCERWANGSADFDGLCRTHLTKVNQQDNTAQVVRARNRMQSSALRMVEVLEHLALKADSEPTRLGAANSLLDRAGLRAGMEIEIGGTVEVTSAADTVRSRLAALAPKDVGVIDAEVVKDGE